MFITVYLYDADGFFLGPYEAPANPEVDGAYLVPVLSTLLAPILAPQTIPQFTGGAWVNVPDFRGNVWAKGTATVSVHNTIGSLPDTLTASEPTFLPDTWPKWIGGEWVNVPDHRGVVWDKSSGGIVQHREIGDLPETLTAIQKPTGFYKWAGSGWVFDLVAAKADKASAMKLACRSDVIAGISHSALGSAHHYPMLDTDQVNMIGLVVESRLPDAVVVYKFWCADNLGVWRRRIHTAAQIQEVGLAFSAHIKTQQEKYEQKLSEISLADEQNLENIAW